MIKIRIIALAVAIIALTASCSESKCDQSMMIKVITQNIKESGRDPSEYRVALVQRRPNGTYIAMEQKQALTYYRHYLIDQKTCKIIEIKIDQ